MFQVSRRDQEVRIDALDRSFTFAAGERVFIEISVKYSQEELDRLNDKAAAQGKDREFANNSASATAERDERMASNCKIAQENMRILRTTSRIQDKDANGEAYFLDEAAIQAKMTATQRQIDNNCK